MAANMATKSQKYVYNRSQVSYNSKWSVEFNIIKVEESIYRSGNSVGMLLSKMAANMAAKTHKYLYLRIIVGYNNKLSVESNILGFKESFSRSSNSVVILIFKMAANMAVKKEICIFRLIDKI